MSAQGRCCVYFPLLFGSNVWFIIIIIIIIRINIMICVCWFVCVFVLTGVEIFQISRSL